MTVSLISAILPKVAYATMVFSAVYSPATLLQVHQDTMAVEKQYVKNVEPPKIISTPKVTPVPTQAIPASYVPQVPIKTESEMLPASTVLSEEQIQFLGNCESGMRPETNTGNGFYGAFQFTIGTWNAMNTGYDRADLAPLDVQIAAVQKLLSRSSIWTQFPGCAAKMHAHGLL